MDYEFRIKQAELELDHLRRLQQIYRERHDAHESNLTALQTIVQRTAENLDILTVQTGKLEAKMEQLEAKMEQLIDALLRGQARNGDQGKA